MTQQPAEIGVYSGFVRDDPQGSPKAGLCLRQTSPYVVDTAATLVRARILGIDLLRDLEMRLRLVEPSLFLQRHAQAGMCPAPVRVDAQRRTKLRLGFVQAMQPIECQS